MVPGHFSYHFWILQPYLLAVLCELICVPLGNMGHILRAHWIGFDTIGKYVYTYMKSWYICICIFLYIIFLYTHACVKSKGLCWCKKEKRNVLYRMTWMFKNNTKETFQIFEFFSFWNKQRVTYISPLLEGTELKTAWYFCQKKRSQEKKNVSLAFYRYCNQPLPTAAHEIRSGLCIWGIIRAGP